MRRTGIAIVTVILIASASMTFAQGAPAAGGTGLDKSGSIRMESDMYPVRVDVARIFAHSQGYKVVYRKGEASFAEAYIPSSWFVAGGKASMIQGRGPQFPYMVVYYKADGSFSHLKLYVLRNMRDSTWGTIEGDPGDRFKVEAIKLEY
ncbi:MAG: hypothetical protein KKA67_14370 [Spirochaetes bacterium]|nr:hypothetical protein [Spirochaetota bacterium]MBU1081529.1 hypothetical protein [Spirochaetota bacterium]